MEKAMQLDYFDYLPDEFRDQAAKLYFLALKDKLEPLLGLDDRVIKAISTNIATNSCIIAVCDRQLAGILGIQTDKGGFLNPSLRTLVKLYGVFGGIFRMVGLALLHHPTSSDELYIDGVAVTERLRGNGIGTRLFYLVERFALKREIRKISLEIVDTNKRAKALYERLGFVQIKKRTLWPFDLIFGFPFKSAIQLVKRIA
jgi:ribosomal protein S18 acetylase RimI-like enzyme